LGKIERAQVVEARDMIGVRVCQQHTIEPAQPDRQRLLAQIRPGVEQERQARHLEQRRRAQTLIMLIRRRTDGAAAANHWYAHGCASPKQGQSHNTAAIIEGSTAYSAQSSHSHTAPPSRAAQAGSMIV
jgi:hypothetical protein